MREEAGDRKRGWGKVGKVERLLLEVVLGPLGLLSPMSGAEVMSLTEV